MGKLKLFMSKLTDGKTQLKDKRSERILNSRNSVADKLDDVTGYTEKSYTKLDHIIGVRTLDILVRDISNANPYKALDLYLRVVNPKYSKVSGFLSELVKDSDKYRGRYINRQGCIVLYNKKEVPYLEIIVRRALVSQLKAMKKYVNDNMLNIINHANNTSRKELVGVSKSRMTDEMVSFVRDFNAKEYDDRQYNIESYENCGEHFIDLNGKKCLGDFERELDVLRQYKNKLSNKAIIALIYNAIQNGSQIDKLKDILVYEEYEIGVKYVRGLNGDTYEIVEKLLRERLPESVLSKLDDVRKEIVSDIEHNLNYYRQKHNTELISYLMLNVLDVLK